MPQFIYEGPGHSLSIAGRNLTRGIPVSLEGRAAEAASSHPDITLVGAAKAPARHTGRAQPTGLAERQALVARAKELGIPASGKTAALRAAITKAEVAATVDATAIATGGLTTDRPTEGSQD